MGRHPLGDPFLRQVTDQIGRLAHQYPPMTAPMFLGQLVGIPRHLLTHGVRIKLEAHISDRLFRPIKLGGVHQQGADPSRLLQSQHQPQVATQAITGNMKSLRLQMIGQS